MEGGEVSAAAAGAVRGLVPFAKGPDPRRNPGGLTKAEQEFRAARDKEMIPEAMAVLREMLADSRDPQMAPEHRQKCRMDFMKCCGLVQKPTDAGAIAALAGEIVERMIAEAKARREQGGGG